MWLKNTSKLIATLRIKNATSQVTTELNDNVWNTLLSKFPVFFFAYQNIQLCSGNSISYYKLTAVQRQLCILHGVFNRYSNATIYRGEHCLWCWLMCTAEWRQRFVISYQIPSREDLVTCHLPETISFSATVFRALELSPTHSLLHDQKKLVNISTRSSQIRNYWTCSCTHHYNNSNTVPVCICSIKSTKNNTSYGHARCIGRQRILGFA